MWPVSWSRPATSGRPPAPSGWPRVSRARSAASMRRAISTWTVVWTLTSGSTRGSSARVEGPRSMSDQGHWLVGRVVVITGASRGIGAATAEAIAAANAHVVLAARDREALDGVARQIRAPGGEATPAPTHVSQAQGVERLFGTAARAGRPAARVCAAGVLASLPLAQTTCEIWQQTLGVNLTGSVLCCRAA